MAKIIGTAGSAPAAKPQKVKAKPQVKVQPNPDNRPAAATPKPVRVRVAPSPDAQDAARLAKHPNVSHVSPDAQDIAGRSAQQHAHDAAVVAQTVSTERRAALRQQHEQRPSLVGVIRQGLHGQGPAKHQLATIKLGLMAQGLIPDPHGQVLHDVVTAAKNAPKDAAELAVTTPSSVAHLASDVVHHPTRVPGELVKPYAQLAADPEKFATTHPVSTALMVAPGVRMPGRVLGKVARIAGKQTLERPAASLPGTALKEARVGSRDFFVRKVQARRDAKNPTPQMTVKQVQTRVDEFHDMAQHHTQRVVNSATRQAKKAAKAQGLDRTARRAAVQTKIEGARGGAHNQIDERFVKEFGAVHQVTPQGLIVKPRHPEGGTLHATREDAQKVADRLNARPASLRTGAGHDTTPLEFTVHQAGEQFGVVPKVAKVRLAKHHAVGTSPATMAKVMRRSRGAFTQAVLPLSPKWLAGQGIEAGIRAGVAGAGPFDLMRFGKVVKRLNAVKPGAGDELKMRVTGGHFDLTGPARDFANGKSLADEFAGTSLERPAKAATAVGNVLPAKAARQGWAKYTHAVLGAVNGALEQTSRKAMAGQAIKNSPLMESHVVGLTDKALQEAAQGLKGTENQVALGRAVDRMYGKYQKFSPDMRSLLLHWTPFLPWYLNVATFLGKVLPVDHPVQAALVADIGAAEEEWRKSHDLSLRQANHVPDFLLGSVPKGGGYLRVAHYTPFGVGSDPVGAVGSLALPQFSTPFLNALGVDWKGQPLMKGGKHGTQFSPTEKGLRALVSVLEDQVPGVTQAGAISGVTPRYVDHATSVASPTEVLRKYLPTTPTGSSSASSSSGVPQVKVPQVKVKPIRVKPIKVKPIRIR